MSDDHRNNRARRPRDTRLRIRVYVDGSQVAERWLDTLTTPPAEVHAVRREHAKMCGEASANGRAWMIEVYDPALPEERAYLRFGTDPAGMGDPREIDTGDIVAAILGGHGTTGPALHYQGTDDRPPRTHAGDQSIRYLPTEDTRRIQRVDLPDPPEDGTP